MQAPVRIAAELRDEDGQAVSTGEAELVLERKLAYFYPRDFAPSDTIRTRAKTLFLSDSNQSLEISELHDCFEQVPHDLHFHLIVK